MTENSPFISKEKIGSKQTVKIERNAEICKKIPALKDAIVNWLQTENLIPHNFYDISFFTWTTKKSETIYLQNPLLERNYSKGEIALEAETRKQNSSLSC